MAVARCALGLCLACVMVKWVGPLRPPPTGPTFDFAALEVHAGGKISEIFGEMFAPQDGYHRQVRMPEAPLLLAHMRG